MPMAAMSDTAGVSTFVQSSRPPSPHSTTAADTPDSRKYQNASAVPISNVVGQMPSRSSAAQARISAFVPRTSSASGMHLPSTRMRSR